MWIPFTAGINISLTSLWKSKLSLGLPACGWAAPAKNFLNGIVITTRTLVLLQLKSNEERQRFMTEKSRSERGGRRRFNLKRQRGLHGLAVCLTGAHRVQHFHLRFYPVFAVLILHRLQPAQQAELAGPAELRQGVHGRPVLLPVFRQYVLFCCCAGAHCAGGVAAAGHPHQQKGGQADKGLPCSSVPAQHHVHRRGEHGVAVDLQPGHGHPEQHSHCHRPE